MFWLYKKTLELKNTIVDLRNKLETSLYKIERLTTFYEETKEAEIDRLNNLVDKLSEKNDELSDAKEAARKELQKEYSDKVANIEDNYARKLEIEIESNTAKLEAIESQKSTEVENRIKEWTAQIQIDNKEVKMEIKHNKEILEIYKKKFESGKIELWADEIKWMLLSANPNGQKILETMASTR